MYISRLAWALGRDVIVIIERLAKALSAGPVTGVCGMPLAGTALKVGALNENWAEGSYAGKTGPRARPRAARATRILAAIVKIGGGADRNNMRWAAPAARGEA